jgi:site-specific recombinase XerD
MSSEKIYLSKRTNGYYYLIIANTMNKKRFIKTISCRTKNKNKALLFLKDYEKSKDTEVLNPSIKISDVSPTILNYASSNLSKGSYEKYELTLRTLLKVLGDKEINSITFSDIENFKSIMQKKLRKETVNIYIRYIRAIWNLLVKLGIISSNKLKSIKQFKTPEKEVISFTNSELELILKNIPDKTIKSIVILASESGLRISELLNLRLMNINFEEELILLSNSHDFQTKSRKNRTISFNNFIRRFTL